MGVRACADNRSNLKSSFENQKSMIEAVSKFSGSWAMTLVQRLQKLKINKLGAQLIGSGGPASGGNCALPK